MTARRTIKLTRDQAAFVERLIDSGRYGSPDSVLQAGLDPLQQQEAGHAERRRRIVEDLESRAQEGPRTFDETTRRLNAWRAQRDGDDAA